MSAHVGAVRRSAALQGLQLVVCASHGVTRYALIRDWWHIGLPILWYRTLGEVQEGLRPPEAGDFSGAPPSLAVPASDGATVSE